MKRFYTSIDRLLSQIPMTDALVADIGCGEGFVTRHLQERHQTLRFAALDLNPGHITLTKQLSPGISAILGDVYDIPVADRTFDVVLVNEILEHLDNPHRALAEIARVARGHVICSAPNEPFFSLGNLIRGSYWHRLGRTPAHVNFWSRRAFARLVNRHLEVRQMKSCVPWTFLWCEVRH
jgi:ubiquinone/menaquinone biosynthesis C-methylase UbiE